MCINGHQYFAYLEVCCTTKENLLAIIWQIILFMLMCISCNTFKMLMFTLEFAERRKQVSVDFLSRSVKAVLMSDL